MDWKLFASTFALIFLAELPGKSTFTTLLLAGRLGPIPVFLGACGAFVIHGMIAVSAGKVLGLLPARPLEMAGGVIFLLLAAFLWRRRRTGSPDPLPLTRTDPMKAAAAAFTVTFVAQWGDLTQAATVALAARYPAPATIFLSSTLALWTVTGIAAALGHHAARKVQPSAFHAAASAALAAVGALLLLHACRS